MLSRSFHLFDDVEYRCCANLALSVTISTKFDRRDLSIFSVKSYDIMIYWLISIGVKRKKPAIRWLFNLLRF